MNKSTIIYSLVLLMFLHTAAYAKDKPKEKAPPKTEVYSEAKTPKNVKRDTICTNMQTINSPQDDYLPFLIGKNTLVFTSNRKNTQEGQTVEFTEKVYWSLEKGKNVWTKPQKTGYRWNSDNNSALVAVSPSLFYFYRSYWQNNGEIFVAQRTNNTKRPWLGSNIRKLKRICTEYDESSITPTNSDSIFFVSNRNGNYDIFVQVGENRAMPVEILNTEYNENDLFFNTDTKTLYFSSNRPGGIGGYDIYEAPIVNNQFLAPRLIKDSLINTSSDDRDFRKYNDSTMYLSSNRMMGLGGFDIYSIRVKTKGIPEEDSIVINIEDKKIPKDTIIEMKNELYAKLKELGLFPFKGEVQVGAYRYIPSLKEFQDKFPCIKTENVRMDLVEIDGIKVHKYIIDTVYTDVDKAVNKQVQIEAMHCLPDKVFTDMPFIAMLDKSGNRFAIFWKKDEFVGKNIFYIFKNGKQVWKNRLF